MEKKTYEKPMMEVFELQHRCQMLAGSLDAHNEVGSPTQFVRSFDGFGDEWGE